MTRWTKAAGLLLGAVTVCGPAVAQWGPGYDDGPGFRGSFRRTCIRIEQRGPFLRALCRDRDGEYVPAGIDTRRCGSFGNRDGQLVCERSPRFDEGRRFAPPPPPPPPAYGGYDDDE